MLSSLDVYYSRISDVRAVGSRTGKKYRSLFFLIFNLRDVNIAEPHFLGAHLSQGLRIAVCNCLLGSKCKSSWGRSSMYH